MEQVKYSYFKEGKKQEVDLFDVIAKTDVWNSGGVTVIGLTGVQKIMEREGIVEKKIETAVMPTEGNLQQHVVNVWVGFKGDNDMDNWVRASGEASRLNTGKVADTEQGRKYIEQGQVDAQYRYAMADKRAICRAVLKFINLAGVYAEVEAQVFANPNKQDIEGNDF